MNFCIYPCLIWCSAGWRPCCGPAKHPCNLARQRYASPAALQVHFFALVPGAVFFSETVTDYIFTGTAERKAGKPRQPPFLNQNDRSTWALLRATYHPRGTQNKRASFCVAVWVTVTPTARAKRKANGKNHSTSHINTHQGGGEREEVTSQQEKKNTSASLRTIEHGTFHGLGVQAYFLLGSVGYRQPNRDFETEHSIPKTKGKHGVSEMENVLKKQSNPPSLHPQTCTKGTDTSEKSLKWCATSLCSQQFSKE